MMNDGNGDDDVPEWCLMSDDDGGGDLLIHLAKSRNLITVIAFV